MITETIEVFESHEEKIEYMKEKYSNLDLTFRLLEDIEIMLCKGPVQYLSCFSYDYEGTPLKYLSKQGQEAAVKAARLQLEKLPLPPDRVYKQEVFDEVMITLEFNPPYLLEFELEEIEEYLIILTRFKEYIDQIEFLNAQINVSYCELPLEVSDRVKKFKELFID